MTLGASFGTTSDWGLGFVAEVRVQPLDHETGAGWTVAFDAAFDITQLWNATVLAHEGQHWVLGNLDWNAVPGPDGVTFGFQGKGSADVANLSAAWVGAAPVPVVAPAAVTVGANTLVLKLSEDAWQGDAQYSVAVDGVQVGGVLTAKPGAAQDVTLRGNWGGGPHTVTVNFLNDAWGGTADTDRNLHVEGISYDGASVPGASAVLLSAGPKDFSIPGSSAPTPPPVTTGANTLVLKISEDAWQGDAQYSVAVDGQIVASRLTATAKPGTPQEVVLHGNWGSGPHTVTVNFLNDAWGGTADTDRNLHVEGISYDGVSVAGASAVLLSAGPKDFAIPGAAPTTGANTLVLKISEDAWQGDAQYSVAVDGVRVGGVLTASPGAAQDVVLRGNWGAGPHTVTVNFLNDAWGGTPDTDRNLHVEGITYDGIAVAGAILFSAGAKDFVIPGAAMPTPSAAGYLHTQGTRIVDDAGRDVILKAVAWTGMETPDFAPKGLWVRNWQDMMDQMKALGFNAIRLPFSSDLLHTGAAPKAIDYGLNPDLAGLSGLQILDRIVDYAGRIGLRIVLDHHLSTAGYGTLSDNPLWYDATHSDAQWVADWQALAARYAGKSAVVGADLHNEPFGSTWGDGSAKDWRAAAERAGNAILSVNPNWLIFVEGNWNANGLDYWWGGNLTGVATAPVNLSIPGRLVYSPHDYGNSVWPQPFFHTADFPNNMPAIFERFWGFITTQNIAPLWLGEFGSNLVDPIDVQWFSQLSALLVARGVGFSYWAFDPSSTDVGGILQADWRTPDPLKMAALRPLLAM